MMYASLLKEGEVVKKRQTGNLEPQINVCLLVKDVVETFGAKCTVKRRHGGNAKRSWVFREIAESAASCVPKEQHRS